MLKASAVYNSPVSRCLLARLNYGQCGKSRSSLCTPIIPLLLLSTTVRHSTTLAYSIEYKYQFITVSLPTTQPFPSQAYSTRMSSTTNWESHLSPQEVRAYGIFFAAANGGKANIVTGQEAVTFFARSGIPNEILSDVSWKAYYVVVVVY